MPEGYAAQDIHQAARRVRDRIDRDGSAAVRSFAEFAEQFALDPKLRDEAVLAGLEISAVSESGKAAPARDLLDLLERIVDDYVRHGGPAALMDRARAQSQARASLEREATTGLAAVVARGIGKTYAKSGFTLGSLSLELRLGQITGVVGQNAHGKTTLLRIVAGELHHDAGALTYPLAGDVAARVDWVKVKSSLAYVPQELPPWRGSLADSLHFEASIRGIHGAQNEREVKFIVERLGLAEHLGKTWRELSGGYKLRFALARALVWKPRILVMDEPLANLDIKAKNILLQDVRELASSYRYPIAVLMSSHELHSLEAVCDQMVFLRNGTVIYCGATDALADQLSGNEFELGSALGLVELRHRLEGTGVLEVREEGGIFLLRTPRAMDHRTLLAQLMERGVDVAYFRDNSSSVRRLFE